MPECIFCGDNKEDGTQIKETEVTRQWGLPTGFACQECLDEYDAESPVDTPVDISQCKSAKQAAEKIRDSLQKLSTNNNDVSIRPPEKNEFDSWHVTWGNGPFDWAIRLTGGESLYSAEFPRASRDSQPEITGFINNPNIKIECKNRKTLSIFNK